MSNFVGFLYKMVEYSKHLKRRYCLSHELNNGNFNFLKANHIIMLKLKYYNSDSLTQLI